MRQDKERDSETETERQSETDRVRQDKERKLWERQRRQREHGMSRLGEVQRKKKKAKAISTAW